MNRRMLSTVFASLLVIVLFVMPAMSQVDGKGVVGKGFKVGANFATLRGTDATGAKTRTGLAIGGFITLGLSRNFAIQPELLYTMKGAKSDVDLLGAVLAEVTVKLDYIEVPVLFTVLVPSPGNVSPRFFAGPAVAFKSSAKGKVELGQVDAESTLDGVKSTDFGLVFGSGLDIKTSGGAFLIEGRYTLGLSTVDDPPSLWNDTNNALDIKNGVFSILAGYSF